MRIAFWVRAGNKYGGLEKYIALFAEMCKSRGHSFLLINEVENTCPDYLLRLQNSGAKQVVVGESGINVLKVFSKSTKYIREWKPDIVDLHFINSLAAPLLRSIGVQIVYHTYHSGIDHPISIRTRVLRSMDNLFCKSVFAVSERVKKDEIRAGIKPSHIKTMYLGVSLDEFIIENNNLQYRPPIGWSDPNLKKIITIGRFSPVKGMRFVVEAATQVLSKRQDAVWWIAGKEGKDSEVCKQLIQSLKMENRIDILGQRNDVTSLVKNCYMQVVGSLSEGLPLAVLEASACGIPTIGTKIGGLDEAIVDGVTGILVNKESSLSLSDAVDWLLDNPEERDKMGVAAKLNVQKKFNSKEQICSLLDQFEIDFAAEVKK
jgi:glycosyltransferase involved in cell wall biosynthesis